MIVPDTIWTPKLNDHGRSKYKALAAALRDAISAGTLAPEEKLPPVRELAYRIGITPGTVARAYTTLTEEGVLIAEVGRGTFVAERGRAAPVIEPPLLSHVDEQTADFRSSRVPDVGQGLVIDAALERLAQSHRRRHMSYPTAKTDIETRAAIATWVGEDRVGTIAVDDVVLGNGAQHCCILTLMHLLHGANPVILTEELAYPGARHAARLLRAKIVGVAMDEEGIIPEALVAAYRTHGGQVLLTAPEVHSPTTIKTSFARKQQLAAVAEKLGLAVIEDDCHTTVATDVPAYRALMSRNAYHVSSLTKSVSGALRFGYIIGPAGQGRALRQVAQSSFYGVAQPIIDLCADLLVAGDAARIRTRVIEKTALRVRTAVNHLGHCDLRWREDAPFVWLQLPTGWRGSSFAVACQRKGMSVRPADEFVLSNAKAPNAVRLAVNACVSDERYEQALVDMRELLEHPEAIIDG